VSNDNPFRWFRLPLADAQWGSILVAGEDSHFYNIRVCILSMLERKVWCYVGLSSSIWRYQMALEVIWYSFSATWITSINHRSQGNHFAMLRVLSSLLSNILMLETLGQQSVNRRLQWSIFAEQTAYKGLHVSQWRSWSMTRSHGDVRMKSTEHEWERSNHGLVFECSH
jgi:hypothetical protein